MIRYVISLKNQNGAEFFLKSNQDFHMSVTFDFNMHFQKGFDTSMPSMHFKVTNTRDIDKIPYIPLPHFTM